MCFIMYKNGYIEVFVFAYISTNNMYEYFTQLNMKPYETIFVMAY